MSLTDDARLVVDSGLGPHKFNHIATVSVDSWKAAVRLATAYIEAGRVDGGECPRCGAVAAWCTVEAKQWQCGSHSRSGQTERCKDIQIANLTARLATVSAELADHKRRLGEQSATLNAVRQERDELVVLLSKSLGRLNDYLMYHTLKAHLAAVDDKEAYLLAAKRLRELTDACESAIRKCDGKACCE